MAADVLLHIGHCAIGYLDPRSVNELVEHMIFWKVFVQLPSEISIPNLPNRWRQNMNSVWTDHYQRPLLTVCLYPRGAEGWEKLQQRPLITNLPLCVKFGTKLMGIRIAPAFAALLKKWDPWVCFEDLRYYQAKSIRLNFLLNPLKNRGLYT